MTLSQTSHLPDGNVLLALSFENHVHHELATAWFDMPGRQWSLCAFTEAGFIRNATAPRPSQITMADATRSLTKLTEHPGYLYLPIDVDWHTLGSPFFKRLYGTKQVTDAYLRGLAIRHDLILVTLDKGIVQLAGVEHDRHVLLLG
jgi:toxin-antitoxin system PIN domain toxin